MLNRVAKLYMENEEKNRTIWNKEVMGSGGKIYIHHCVTLLRGKKFKNATVNL